MANFQETKPAVKSRSFQGIILLIIPALVPLLGLAGIDLDESQLVGAVTAISTAVGAVLGIWGTLRRKDVSGVLR